MKHNPLGSVVCSQARNAISVLLHCFNTARFLSKSGEKLLVLSTRLLRNCVEFSCVEFYLRVLLFFTKSKSLKTYHFRLFSLKYLPVLLKAA